MHSVRSNVLGIATTLRAGRSGDLVLVWTRVSIHLQNIIFISGAQTSSSRMGTGPLPDVRRVGA
jgi:hypothetical protein